MKYEELFEPQNVMTLARMTDKTQKSLSSSQSAITYEQFDSIRRKIFQEEIAIVNS